MDIWVKELTYGGSKTVLDSEFHAMDSASVVAFLIELPERGRTFSENVCTAGGKLSALHSI